MQRQIFTAFFMAVGICALLIVASAQGQPGEDDRQNPGQQPQNQRDQDRTQAGRQGEEGQKTVRASELIGQSIENPQGEDIGEIKDLVIDVGTAEVSYVAVTYVDLPDAHDKMFAVPFEAFEARHEPDDPDTCIIVLDVTQQQLERAEGFEANNWPDFTNLQFTSGIDELYGVEREDEDREREQRQRQDGQREERQDRPGARP